MKSFQYLVIISSIVCFILFKPTIAQTPINTNGMWLMYNGDNKINSKIGIHSEVQLRNFFLDNNIQQSIVRVGLHHYISPFSMITAGYANIHTDPSKGTIANSTNEHRAWQQLILRFKSKALFIEHRFRLEQRWIKNITQNNDIYNDKIRYRFQTIFPFYIISPSLRHIFILGSNEFFANYRNNKSAEIFDRNRLFISLGYQVSPKLNFQLGYLHQYVNTTGVIEPTLNSIFQLSFAYNMDDLMSTIFGK